jgi:hypothetical protein
VQTLDRLEADHAGPHAPNSFERRRQLGRGRPSKWAATKPDDLNQAHLTQAWLAVPAHSALRARKPMEGSSLRLRISSRGFFAFAEFSHSQGSKGESLPADCTSASAGCGHSCRIGLGSLLPQAATAAAAGTRSSGADEYLRNQGDRNSRGVLMDKVADPRFGYPKWHQCPVLISWAHKRKSLVKIGEVSRKTRFASERRVFVKRVAIWMFGSGRCEVITDPWIRGSLLRALRSCAQVILP